MSSLFSLPTFQAGADQQHWGQLVGAALPLALSELVTAQAGLYVVLVPDTPTALRLEQELMAFLPDGIELFSFPDWETLTYDHFSAHQDII